MISIATIKDLPIIQSLAKQTWPETYGEILSAAQVEYMLEKFYSINALEQNLKSGHILLLYRAHNEYEGFAGFEINDEFPKTAHLHKLYVLPKMQGKFIGHQLLNDVMMRCKNADCKTLSLNVNRFNKAKTFYEKFGFRNIKNVDIEIGNGYLMEDFILEKVI